MPSRLLAFVSAAALVMATGTAVTQAQTSVAGEWVLSVNGPQGTVDTDASFRQSGDKVTGTFSSQMGETNVEGTMSGSTLSLAFNVVTPNGPIDIRMTAEVAGAEMKGTIDYGMGTADFTGKKK
jgi:hypothetical protein